MQITSNVNGNIKTTSYGNKVFYRENSSSPYTQVKRVFYRENPSSNFTQVYLFDNTGPTIMVTSLLADTSVQTYILTGSVLDTESGINSVKINDFIVTLSGNSFSRTYTLSSGYNTYTITATDNAGNISQSVVTIKYVNQKDDSNNNWTETREVKDGNMSYYQVKSDGVWTTIQYRQYNSSTSSWDTASTSGTFSVLLPKGISSANIPCAWYGASSNGNGAVTVTLVDLNTGQTLFSDSNSNSSGGYGGVTIAMNFTQDQSTHNLQLTISGRAWGREYAGAGASFGLGVVWYGFNPNWTFTYY